MILVILLSVILVAFMASLMYSDLVYPKFRIDKKNGRYYPMINKPLYNQVPCYEYIDKDDGRYVPWIGLTEEEMKEYTPACFGTLQEAKDFIKRHYEVSGRIKVYKA